MKNKIWTQALLLGLLCTLGVTGCAGTEGTNPAADPQQTETAENNTDNNNTDNNNTDNTDNTENPATEEKDILEKDPLDWEGKSYSYNDRLNNYLFIGVDKDTIRDTETGRADAGQADALFLLSHNSSTGDVTLITIPRDTMTMVNVFGVDGTDLGPTRQHISVSYAYGDGRHESCELTEEAVSRLFYRIPIQGYCAITMDALPEVAEAVGPVPVTLPNDSMEEKYPQMKEGTEAEITAENIEAFLRYRDTTEDHSALERSERQEAYLSACADRLISTIGKDGRRMAELLESLEPYMVTSMSNDRFYDILEGLNEGGSLERWTVPGEGVVGSSFDEYHVDEDALYESILNTFFEVK